MTNKELDGYLRQLREEGSKHFNLFNEEAAKELLACGLAQKKKDLGNGFYLEITEQGKAFEGFEERDRRIKLNERVVKSAEVSAEAAKESAKSAKTANRIAIFALLLSLISIVLSIYYSYIAPYL